MYGPYLVSKTIFVPESFAKLRWISLHLDLFTFICWKLSSGIIACPGSWSSCGSGTIVRPRAMKSDARRRITQQPLTPVPALATASAETKSSRNMEIPFISRLLGSKESRCTGSGSEGSYLFLSLGIRRRTYSSDDIGSCWFVTYVRCYEYLLCRNFSYNAVFSHGQTRVAFLPNAGLVRKAPLTCTRYEMDLQSPLPSRCYL